MIFLKSLLAALKWNIVLFTMLYIVLGSGSNAVSPAVFSVLGFVIFMIMFTLENLELRH